jgi:hypothetical protein
MQNSSTDRRAFLAGILGAGGALLSPSRARADFNPVSCSPRSPFTTDSRPDVLERRPVGQTDVDKLRKAYGLMKQWDTDHLGDPRGFMFQASIHQQMSSFQQGVNQLHQCWHFFPWHRAYLYFHERILAWHLGNRQNLDETFRLPVWDWESHQDSYYKAPAYFDPPNSTNPLWIDGRFGSDAGTFLQGFSAAFLDALKEPLTRVFYSGPAGQHDFGNIEGTPHGAMHLCTGGKMGVARTAAYDPLFYAHHANVDKMWTWRRHAIAKDVPSDPAWLSGTLWTFYDESAQCVAVKPTDLLDEAALKYSYAKPPPALKPEPANLVQPVRLEKSSLRLTAAVSNGLRDLKARVSLRLTGVTVPNVDAQFFIIARASNGTSALIAVVAPFGHLHAAKTVTGSISRTLSNDASTLLARSDTKLVIARDPGRAKTQVFGLDGGGNVLSDAILKALPTTELKASAAALSVRR